jgi:hypothetical protein
MELSTREVGFAPPLPTLPLAPPREEVVPPVEAD